MNNNYTYNRYMYVVFLYTDLFTLLMSLLQLVPVTEKVVNGIIISLNIYSPTQEPVIS